MKLQIKVDDAVTFDNCKDALMYITDKLYEKSHDSVFALLNNKDLQKTDLQFTLAQRAPADTFDHFILHILKAGLSEQFTIRVIDTLITRGLFDPKLVSANGSQLVLFAVQLSGCMVLRHLLSRCRVSVLDTVGNFVTNSTHFSTNPSGLPSYTAALGKHNLIMEHLLSPDHHKVLGDDVAKWAMERGYTRLVNRFIAIAPDRVVKNTQTKQKVNTIYGVTTTEYKVVEMTVLASNGIILKKEVTHK